MPTSLGSDRHRVKNEFVIEVLLLLLLLWLCFCNRNVGE